MPRLCAECHLESYYLGSNYARGGEVAKDGYWYCRPCWREWHRQRRRDILIAKLSILCNRAAACAMSPNESAVHVLQLCLDLDMAELLVDRLAHEHEYEEG